MAGLARWRAGLALAMSSISLNRTPVGSGAGSPNSRPVAAVQRGNGPHGRRRRRFLTNAMARAVPSGDLRSVGRADLNRLHAGLGFRARFVDGAQGLTTVIEVSVGFLSTIVHFFVFTSWTT